jgi:hypothetical protein
LRVEEEVTGYWLPISDFKYQINLKFKIQDSKENPRSKDERQT